MNKSLSILIVDDNESQARSLQDVLELKGFKVHSAYSGAAALEILLKHPIDILLTDVKMPEMDGVTLNREASKIRPNITTILMTAFAADELIQQGIKDGIKTVLNKPVNIDFLVSLFSATQSRITRPSGNFQVL